MTTSTATTSTATDTIPKAWLVLRTKQSGQSAPDDFDAAESASVVLSSDIAPAELQLLIDAGRAELLHQHPAPLPAQQEPKAWLMLCSGCRAPDDYEDYWAVELADGIDVAWLKMHTDADRATPLYLHPVAPAAEGDTTMPTKPARLPLEPLPAAWLFRSGDKAEIKMAADIVDLNDLMQRIAAGQAEPLYLAAQAMKNELEIDRDALIEIIAAEITDTYVCGRNWSAWQFGEMGENDFSPASDNAHLLSCIADGVIAYVLNFALQQAASATQSKSTSVDLVASGVLTPEQFGALALAVDTRLDCLYQEQANDPQNAHWQEQDDLLCAAMVPLGIDVHLGLVG